VNDSTTVDELVVAVATALGDGWVVGPREDDTRTRRLDGPEGFGLKLRVSGKGDSVSPTARVRVKGLPCLHDRWRRDGEVGQARRVTITVAARRGAAAIAREIEDRFLPRYRPEYEEYLETAARMRQYSEAMVKEATKLAEAADGEVIREASILPELMADEVTVALPYEGQATMNVDGTCDLSLSRLPLSTALQIAGLIRGQLRRDLYVMIWTHKHGHDEVLVLSPVLPDPEDVVRKAGLDYEPEIGEELELRTPNASVVLDAPASFETFQDLVFFAMLQGARYATFSNWHSGGFWQVWNRRLQYHAGFCRDSETGQWTMGTWCFNLVGPREPNSQFVPIAQAAEHYYSQGHGYR